MAPLMDYERPADDPPGRLHLADDLRKRLGGYGEDWPAKITDADLAGLDFAWLPALAQFDHWTLLGAGRLRDRPATDFFNDPIPNYIHLLYWARLRYALALRRGDVLAASTEVRHLAELIRTQGILISEMIAVVLARLDLRGREAAFRAGLDVSAWAAPDNDQLDRHRRMAFASMYFTYPGVPPEVLRKAVGCMPSPCSALLEGAGANRAFGAFGTVDNFEVVDELAKAHGCEPAVLARVHQSVELPAGDALRALADDLDRRIPDFFNPKR